MIDAQHIPLALQSDGAPNGYHILSIDRARYTTTQIPARDPNRGQIRLVQEAERRAENLEAPRTDRPGLLPAGPIRTAALSSTRLIANFFAGGARSNLEMAFGPGNFTAMTHVELIDPFVA